ncbi:hypothetical protein ABT126_37315 [Streptomyces sp. NPDC002012]|uniref:hypothetical protein n=1 Tax=Streptomyces sp. NPDC002012 TaxID=3154532 RepID=UPI003332ED84
MGARPADGDVRADIHDALVGLATELQRRIDHADQHGNADDLPRLTMVFEEADATLRKLARYWDTIRQKDDPKTSPAVDALNEILFAGRQARIYVLFDGHPTNSALDGGEGRELFSTVVLARVPTSTWDRFAPQVDPAPKGSTHPRPRRAGLDRPPDAGAAPDRGRSRRVGRRHGGRRDLTPSPDTPRAPGDQP